MTGLLQFLSYLSLNPIYMMEYSDILIIYKSFNARVLNLSQV